LIVLDLEIDESYGEEYSSPLLGEATQHNTPVVVLGSVRRGESLPPGEFVSKPYHYAPLVRRIEELLTATGQTDSRGV
jgi:hypothetical protein